MDIKIDSNTVLLLAMFAMGGTLYNKFYHQAEKVSPSDPHAIVYTKDSLEYQPSYHLDANFDGYITQHEINLADRYKFTHEGFDFVDSLSKQDRLLVNGLRVSVAKSALQQLSENEKQALLQLNIKDRVKLLNRHFAHHQGDA